MRSDSIKVSLSAWEHNLYESGVKRGHADGASEAAEQLRVAGEHYAQQVDNAEQIDEQQAEALRSWLSVFDLIAKQLDEGATVAKKQAIEKLNIAFQNKHKRRPTLPERIRRAIIAAVDGYKSEGQ